MIPEYDQFDGVDSDPEIITELIDFKDTKIREIVRENEDGTHTILINSRFDSKSNQISFLHALSHIKNNDFEKSDIQQIESEAHGIAEIAPVSAKAPERTIQIRKPRKHLKRRSSKKWKEINEKISFMEKYFTPDQLWMIAENDHLYGGI